MKKLKEFFTPKRTILAGILVGIVCSLLPIVLRLKSNIDIQDGEMSLYYGSLVLVLAPTLGAVGYIQLKVRDMHEKIDSSHTILSKNKRTLQQNRNILEENKATLASNRKKLQEIQELEQTVFQGLRQTYTLVQDLESSMGDLDKKLNKVDGSVAVTRQKLTDRVLPDLNNILGRLDSLLELKRNKVLYIGLMLLFFTTSCVLVALNYWPA